ncbi:dihydropteroate synthase [Tropicimonas sp. IMCC34011]|uniref:dihydropteroate synthase n=1 Tax=Tropicimonas sp. IMCC34011 TaxID=2248759 RepID=UPI000E23480D|nr:dihydropteroate synthase [Tropicimonas sp. IMCC34011]
MSTILRPIARTGQPRGPAALPLAGSRSVWFDEVEVLEAGRTPALVPARELDAAARDRLSAPRPALCGMTFETARIMGIINVTPDSFSDGGLTGSAEAAAEAARHMSPLADLLDIGGESTRPGAEDVPEAEEIARVAPAIAAIRDAGIATPVSIDTRKAAVAEAALGAGADMVNDVSALTFDPALGPLTARHGAPLCLMHAKGLPKTMQDAPAYGDVLHEVMAALRERIAAAEAMGVARERLIVDPGIGFGKTADHNLQLIRNLSAFHDLGLPVLLGVSRKRFIGAIGKEAEPRRRAPGSIAVALAALAQGVHILRVHDVGETRQAMNLAQALYET